MQHRTEPPAAEPAILPHPAVAPGSLVAAPTLAPIQGVAWWLLVPAGLVVGAAAALSVDIPLARWCTAGNCPSLLQYLFQVAEPFGHGMGVLLIALTLHQLDPGRRWALPRVLTSSLVAGLAADVLKLLVARTRPYHFSFQGDVWSTFGGWLPLTGAGSAGQSFPSAHTATAVGLALALRWLYPNGRWLFPTLAVLVGCQRIESGAHYLSDVLCGAAVGCLVATVCLRPGAVSRLFDALEARWKRSRWPAAASRGPKSAAR